MGSRIRGNNSAGQDRQYDGMAMTSHDRMREQLARDVEEFLAHGGHITELEPHMRSGLSDNEQDSF
ncbi:hypothetical protein [Spongiibacter sp.]|uniref:hypothetical protein n=1 Tax=Spongiibacter sp. TaxID=2024860 RepID=UPI003564BF61